MTDANSRRLGDLATVIRSKNAGIHYLTVDIMFDSREVYEGVKASGALSRAVVADRYGLDPESVRFFAYDAGLAFKATFSRDRSAGSPGDPDLYGAQQHAPLLDVVIPTDSPNP